MDFFRFQEEVVNIFHNSTSVFSVELVQVARLEPCMSLEKLLPTLVLLTSFVRIRCDKSPQGYAIYFWDIIQCVVLKVA